MYHGIDADLDELRGLTDDNDPVGLAEISADFGIPRATVDKWRTRDVLPEPEWIVGGRPAWRRSTIRDWYRARTGDSSPEEERLRWAALTRRWEVLTSYPISNIEDERWHWWTHDAGKVGRLVAQAQNIAREHA